MGPPIREFLNGTASKELPIKESLGESSVLRVPIKEFFIGDTQIRESLIGTPNNKIPYWDSQ